MNATTKQAAVRVVYWAGTTQREAIATSYFEALEIAERNQNTHDPKFYDVATGEQLYDDGNGLCNEDRTRYTL